MRSDGSCDGEADHAIRLRGPWTSAEQRHDHAVSLGQYTAPDGLAANVRPDFQGVLILERHFNRPTGLSANSRVALWIESSHAGAWELNGAPLGVIGVGTQRADATPHLQLSNRLTIRLTIDRTPAPAPPRCDVRLEIFDGA